MINSVVNTGSLAKPPPQTSVAVASSVSATSVTPATTEAKPTAPAANTFEANSEQLKTAVSKLNDYVQNVQRTLSFSIDKGSGDTVVKVFDTETKELVRQIPAEATLKMAAAIDEQLTSLSIQDRA